MGLVLLLLAIGKGLGWFDLVLVGWVWSEGVWGYSGGKVEGRDGIRLEVWKGIDLINNILDLLFIQFIHFLFAAIQLVSINLLNYSKIYLDGST